MNLEEIWKWLKGKRNTFFAEAATAFILIAVLGVAGITAGRSGITNGFLFSVQWKSISGGKPG